MESTRADISVGATLGQSAQWICDAAKIAADDDGSNGPTCSTWASGLERLAKAKGCKERPHCSVGDHMRLFNYCEDLSDEDDK